MYFPKQCFFVHLPRNLRHSVGSSVDGTPPRNVVAEISCDLSIVHNTHFRFILVGIIDIDSNCINCLAFIDEPFGINI